MLTSGDTVMKNVVMVYAFMELMFMGEVNIKQFYIYTFFVCSKCYEEKRQDAVRKHKKII